jgi:hypothetical protein
MSAAMPYISATSCRDAIDPIAGAFDPEECDGVQDARVGVTHLAAVVELPLAGPVGVGGGEDVAEPAGHPGVVTDQGAAVVGDGHVVDVADRRVAFAELAGVPELEDGAADGGAAERGDGRSTGRRW